MPSPLHNQTCKIRRAVSLKFSIKGVKMYDEDETVRIFPPAVYLLCSSASLIVWVNRDVVIPVCRRS